MIQCCLSQSKVGRLAQLTVQKSLNWRVEFDMGIKLSLVDLTEFTLLILGGINHDSCVLFCGHHDE